MNDEKTFEGFSFFQLSAIALKKSCNRLTVSQTFRYIIFETSFKRQKDVTPSNAMTGTILHWTLTSASAQFQNCDFVVSCNTIFSIGYILARNVRIFPKGHVDISDNSNEMV